MFFSRVDIYSHKPCAPCKPCCILVQKNQQKRFQKLPSVAIHGRVKGLNANLIVIFGNIHFHRRNSSKASACKPSRPVQVLEKAKETKVKPVIVSKPIQEESGPTASEQFEEVANNALSAIKEGAGIAAEKIGNAVCGGAQVAGEVAETLWNALPEWETVKAEIQDAGAKIGNALEAGVSAVKPAVDHAVVNICEDINGVNRGIQFAADRTKGVATGALFHTKRGIETAKSAKANAEMVVKDAIANAEMVAKEGIEKFERSVNHHLRF